MQDNPLISIVTVCLNNAEDLEKTILNVKNQNYKFKEHIIIDGGSVDDTVNVIKKYKECTSYWVSEKDNGVYDAMNKGILKSSGEIINFLNAGDCYYDNSVLNVVSENFEGFEKPEIIYGLSESFSVKENIKYISGSKINENNLWKGMPICHQSMFFNKKVFQEIGLYDLRYKNMADYEFLLRYFKNKQNKKIIFIEKPLCKFALYGLSDSDYLANLKEIELISKKYYPFSFLKKVYFFIKRIKYYFLKILKNFKIYNLYRKIKYNIFFKEIIF